MKEDSTSKDSLNIEELNLPKIKISELLQLNLRLRNHPLFQDDIKALKLNWATELHIKSKSKRDKISNRNLDITDVEVLDKAANDKLITKKEKEFIQHTVNIAAVTNDHFELVELITKDIKITSAKDLARWTKEDWQKVLSTTKEQIPNEEKQATYIKNVMTAVEQSFPTEVLVGKIKGLPKSEIKTSLLSLSKLLENNDIIFGAKKIDWTGVTNTERTQLEKSIDTLSKNANTYKHLRLADILNSNVSATKRADQVSQRVAEMDSFFTTNPDLDLAASNFIKKSNTDLNWTGVSEEMQPLVRKQLLSFQRVHHLSPDADTSKVLLESNYDSAYSITNRGVSAFMADTQLGVAQANQIFAQAQRRTAQVAHQYHSLIELEQNRHLALPVDNTIPHAIANYTLLQDPCSTPETPTTTSLYDQVRNELQDIDGYADLFGPQNFCQCDHCKSIFSPAAYFVDLMHFIQVNITNHSQQGYLALPTNATSNDGILYTTQYPCNAEEINYPLWLQNRRPDLWDIEISCDCTYQMIPYLEIVNSIKEAYIKKLWVEEGRITQLDAATIDVYAELYRSGLPAPSYPDINKIYFYSPSSTAFKEMLLHLDYFDISHFEILKVNRTDLSSKNLAYLKVLEEEIEYIGSPYKLFGNSTTFTTMKVTEFLKHTKLSRQDLTLILATDYISDNSTIKVEKSVFDEGIQYYDEELVDINASSLRYLVHFIRWWQKLPWSIQEFDLVLEHIRPATGSTPIASTQIEDISMLLQIQDLAGLNIEEMIGVLYIIPNKSLSSIEKKDALTGELYEEAQPGYLDQHFDVEKITSTDADALSYALSGLKVSQSDYEEMKTWKWIDGSAARATDTSTIQNMQSFFRHLKLSKALQFSLDEWATILRFKNDPFIDPPSTPDIPALFTFIEEVQQIKNSRFTIAQLELLVQPTEDNYSIIEEDLLSILYNVEPIPFTTQSIIEYTAITSTEALDLIAQLQIDGIIIQSEIEGEYLTTQQYDWQKLEAAASVNIWSSKENVLKDFFNQHHSCQFITSHFFSIEDFRSLADFSDKEVEAIISSLQGANAIITHNNGLSYRVLDTFSRILLDTQFDLLPVSNPDEELIRTNLLASKDALFELLMVHHPTTSYVDIVMKLSGLDSPELILELSSNLEINFNSDIYTKLSTNLTDGLPANFINFAQELKRWGTLIGVLDLSHESLSFLNHNHLPVFGIDNVGTQVDNADNPGFFSFENIYKLEEYAAWVSQDREVLDSLLHPMLLDIRTDQFSVDTVAAFNHYYDLSGSSVTDIFRNYNSGSGSYDEHSNLNRVQFASYIRDRALLCQKLGINRSQLDRFSNTTYESMQVTWDLLQAQIRSEFEDETSFDKAYIKIEEKQNELRRDILCDYILARKEVNFKDKNELYAYFLIDPQMSGCMKISKIVAAHLSLQLYVHRVILNLEQNQVVVNGSIGTNFKAFLDPLVREEWEWRKNYRVAEANRKVAVYPENFIEPEWRDNKSPEFKQLEEELLQQKITTETAEVAYQGYLRKLDTLSILAIGGVCLNKALSIPEYYLFGRDHNQPFQYYWRTLKVYDGVDTNGTVTNSKDFSPWEKVEIPIDSNFVSPYIYQGKIYLFWMSVIVEENASFTQGTSDGSIYSYRYILNYSYLNVNSKWVQPQKIEGISRAFESFFEDDLINLRSFKTGKTFNRVYPIVVDGTLYVSVVYDNGVNYNGHANNYGRNFKVDLYNKELKVLFGLQDPPSSDYYFDISTEDAPEGRISIARCNFHNANLENALGKNGYTQDKHTHHNIAPGFIDHDPNTDLRIVHMHQHDSHLRFQNQSFLIRDISKWPGLKYEGTRISTSVFQELVNSAYQDGINNFLSPESQYLPELPIQNLTQNFASWQYTEESTLTLNFKGAFGTYFRELFFHIPFLVADHLNAEGKYQEADWWYKKIFDPSAVMDDHVGNPVDRNWQYVEFRNQIYPRYSEDLTDQTFIENYKANAFNPHIIARFRSSTYPKAIILKYIDNLLDWGDSLFRKFTFESNNEAMMLYVIAQDILGDRPQELCKCETASDDQLTYADVEDSLNSGTDFLIWLENHQIVEIPQPPQDIPASGVSVAARVMSYQNTAVDVEPLQYYSYEPAYNYISNLGALSAVQTITTRKLLFCVPMNKEILGLWDRVEDRLFKIRHCMNIDGTKQTLSLFPPAIDPRLLVAARASGLNIADAIASLDAPVPNYRFTYMLEKAKSFAGTVQGLGNGLLSAMEKKDGEELTLLRSVHEQNILKMTKKIKQNSIDESKAQLNNLLESKKNIENRIDYYSGLIDLGLLSGEEKQQELRAKAGKKEDSVNIMRILSSYLRLVPQLGAPTAITFGGQQLGHSMDMVSSALSAEATSLMRAAETSGVEAGNQRRGQEWENQLKLSEQELKAMEQQIVASEIRLSIAEKDLEIHENQIEQAKELYDFYKDKFSNLGLYKYMATTMNRLFSQAYNLAFEMAKQAEKCYQFETDDLNYFIENDNWDAGYA